VDRDIREGAKFWLSVFTELQHRGVKDLFIACVDGLTGLPEAIETLYPQTRVQLCMVHLVRNSLKYVSYKHRKEVATDLNLIYGAATEAEAQVYLDLFAEKWDRLYSTISKLWRARLLSRDPLVCLPSRHSPRDLHHQCHRVGQHVLTQGDAQSPDFSLR
jgi:putative transposase